MSPPPAKQYLFGGLTMLFGFLTLGLLSFGLNRGNWDQGNFWILILCFSLLLQFAYFAVYFLLRTLHFAKPHTASAFARRTAAIVAIPVTGAAVFLLVSIGRAMIGSGIEIFDYLIGVADVLILLGIPAFFFWRHVWRGRRKRNDALGQGVPAEQC